MATLGGARLRCQTHHLQRQVRLPNSVPRWLVLQVRNQDRPRTVDDHKKCSCGEHCGCNPCTCARSAVTTGVGKAYCKCGDACTCVSCAA